MRLKIKDLEVGKTQVITLAVVSSSVKQTKTGKDYVHTEFFDGTDKINGNWWNCDAALRPNSILDVSAEVSTYNDIKQITVKKAMPNTTLSIDDFMPKSSVDESDIYCKVINMLSLVKDDFLRNFALQLFEDNKDMWLSVPGAVKMHHAYKAGTLIHSYEVARIAYVISGDVKGANRDLCLVGGLLHDVGKLLTYKTNGVNIDMTDQGLLFDHTYIGMVMLQSLGTQYLAHTINTEQGVRDHCKLEMLLHIVGSHHGKMEYGAITTPSSIEAIIVSAADGISAATTQLNDASKDKDPKDMFTDRVWALNNRQQVLPQYVYSIMKEVIYE